ncbi:hypothetical protein ID47_02885 [Candidatus Paracaedibacter acanthamoebae]|uniref:Uncharacterized protein n=1 Tax=Candidatus Odyssella acanthamoebae TaxID=91604 RepID=A0A077AV23_9PROT|nr:hypothetical protein ID47_02885 [Candidatus Paracaedibacter acanthamoebae]
MDNQEFIELLERVKGLVQHTHSVDIDMSLMEFHRLWTENVDKIGLPNNMKKDHNTFACFYYHYMFLRSLEQAAHKPIPPSLSKPRSRDHLTLVKG